MKRANIAMNPGIQENKAKGSNMTMCLFLVLPFLTVTEYWIPRFIPGLNTILPFLGEPLIYAVCGLSLLKAHMHRNITFFHTRINLLVLGFIGWVLLGNIANNVNPIVAALHLRMMIRYPFLLLIVMNSQMNRKQLRIVLHGLLILAAFEAVLGILHAVFPIQMEIILGRKRLSFIGDMKAISFKGKEGLAVGTLPRYNHFGAYMAFCFILVFSLWWFRESGKKRQYWLHISVLLFGAGLLMSSSGIPIISVCCCLFLFSLVNYRDRIGFTVLIFALIITAVATVVIMKDRVDPLAFAGGEEGPFNRFFSLFTFERLDRAQQFGRVYMHKTVIPRILKNFPFVGLGLGTVGSPLTGSSVGYIKGPFSQYSRVDELGVPFVLRNNYPLPHYISDSGWLSLFAQTGLIGSFLYSLILFESIRHLWQCHRLARTQDDALLAGLSGAALYAFIFYIICGFVTAGYIHRYYLQSCCIICAMSISAYTSCASLGKSEKKGPRESETDQPEGLICGWRF
ncbi:MAG: hypothetical protein GY795_13400 [Desulfobacterales bacterium]|nr:hypothetical protein [Desulfobacterales bacterium]